MRKSPRCTERGASSSTANLLHTADTSCWAASPFFEFLPHVTRCRNLLLCYANSIRSASGPASTPLRRWQAFRTSLSGSSCRRCGPLNMAPPHPRIALCQYRYRPDINIDTTQELGLKSPMFTSLPRRSPRANNATACRSPPAASTAGPPRAAHPGTLLGAHPYPAAGNPSDACRPSSGDPRGGTDGALSWRHRTATASEAASAWFPGPPCILLCSISTETGASACVYQQYPRVAWKDTRNSAHLALARHACQRLSTQKASCAPTSGLGQDARFHPPDCDSAQSARARWGPCGCAQPHARARGTGAQGRGRPRNTVPSMNRGLSCVLHSKSHPPEYSAPTGRLERDWPIRAARSVGGGHAACPFFCPVMAELIALCRVPRRFGS